MADRGRDLKVSILSDADQFDLAKPADDLDRLGDSAQDASRDLDSLAGVDLDRVGSEAKAASDGVERLARSGDDLDRLSRGAQDATTELRQLSSAGDQLDSIGKDATGAADDVERLAKSGAKLDRLGKELDGGGKDAKAFAGDVQATAKKVDASFDAIASASKRGLGGIDKAADKASEGLDTFKDEAASTGREAAASFTGSFDDIASGVQEVAANAFGGLGPIGAAAGIAAAAGIGILITSLNETKERVAEIRSQLVDLGMDEAATELDRYTAAVDQLRERGDLTELRESVEAAGVAWTDYVDAYVNGGPKVEEVKAKLDALGMTAGGLAELWDSNASGAQDAFDALTQGREAAQGAATDIDAIKTATSGLNESLPEASQLVEDFGSALESFTDPAGVYTDLLTEKETAERKTAQETAQATKSQKDSWEDYAKGVSVSVDEYLDELERQVQAQEGWSKNLKTLARRGVTEGVLSELAKMGPQGAPLVAKLTKASDAELSRMVALYARKGREAAGDLQHGVESAKPGVAGAVADIRADMKRRLAPPVPMRATITGPSRAQVAGIRRDVSNNLRPVVIPVMLQQVKTSTWSRFIP